LFIGGNEQVNSSDSAVKESLEFESDKLEEEKIAGDRAYFKGKPKNVAHANTELHCNEQFMRSRSPVGFPEPIKRAAKYQNKHDLDNLSPTGVFYTNLADPDN
jgi:hypothetical protein